MLQTYFLQNRSLTSFQFQASNVFSPFIPFRDPELKNSTGREKKYQFLFRSWQLALCSHFKHTWIWLHFVGSVAYSKSIWFSRLIFGHFCLPWLCKRDQESIPVFYFLWKCLVWVERLIWFLWCPFGHICFSMVGLFAAYDDLWPSWFHWSWIRNIISNNKLCKPIIPAQEKFTKVASIRDSKSICLSVWPAT